MRHSIGEAPSIELTSNRVYNILAGEKEAERVLFREEDTEQGFVLLPDLKWDQTSMNAMVRFAPDVAKYAAPPDAPI